MTNRGDRLVRIEKITDKLNRLRNHPELIRVGYSSRQQQSIKIAGIGLLQSHIDWKAVPFFKVVPSLHSAARRRKNLCLGTGRLKGFFRLRQFYLFETFGNKNGDF